MEAQPTISLPGFSNQAGSVIGLSNTASIPPLPQIKTAPSTNAVQADKESEARPRETAYRLAVLLISVDWIVAFGSIVSGLMIREWERAYFVPSPTGQIVLSSTLLLWSMITAMLFSWLMIACRTYEVRHVYRINHALKNVVRCAVLWAIAIWAWLGLTKPVDGFMPRVGVAYCIVTLVIGFVLWRACSLVFLSSSKIKRAASARILAVGWNEKVAHLDSAMRMDLAPSGEFLGCVPMPDGQFGLRPPSDIPVLGDYANLHALVRNQRVNSIVLTDVSCPSAEILNLVTFCQREMIEFKMVPNYFPALTSGLQVNTTSGVPLLSVCELPLDKTVNRVIKRTLDIVGAIIGICLSTLIIPWFCLLVFVESPGPVIYRQRRTTRGGRIFKIYKIRSMRLNAENTTGAVWCSKEDPRRLRIGAFMRKWNIDELPQFLNVLKGDMSLVGPRPERPELISRFKGEIPNYNARHEVRSGVTGWAQIHGLRGDTDLRKRVEADLYYLENWNVLLDLYCLVATFFKTKNAH